jgi:DNA-binding CsgD family transcriptional regulator/tetratricopeptide (TPR) repeat protein
VIGRDRERARLDGAFHAACAGQPVTVLVAGEAGIGKTRLVAEFTQDVAADAIVLAGGCIDERVPYLPVADAVRSLLRSGWQPGELTGGWDELGALVPELAGQASGGQREAGSSGRLHSAFLRLLETLCRERPVILVVEDLHWSDVSTRTLLTYTMRAARDIPLLLIGTYRIDDLTRRHLLRPFLAETTRLPSTEIIELERLDIADVRQLLAEILGTQPAQGIVDDVNARCEGNPFLIEEVTAADVDHRSGRLPARLQDILLARTAFLSPTALEVLRVAAVGGPRVDDRLLRTVVPLVPEVLDAALRELLDCHILEPDGEHRGYVFRHALTAEAVYEDTLPGERVRHHAAFARAIGKDRDLAAAGGALTAVERAQHWHRAHQSTEALGAWVEAATEAEHMYAYPEALAAYENALELWPTLEAAEALAGMDEVELLRRAAEAAKLASAPARALTFVQHALALVDERDEPLRAAVLVERLGRYSWASGREDDALSYYQRAVELAPEQPPSAERARALAGHAQILMLHWRDTAAARRALEAIDAARRAGAVAVEAHALSTLALAKGYQGDEAAALAAMEQSARLTERTDDDENIWRLSVNRVYLLFGLGHLQEAAAIAPQGRAALRDVGLVPIAGAHFATNESLPLVDLGRWDEARVILDEEIGRAPSGSWRAQPLQTRSWLNWLTGNIDGAERDLDEIQRLAPDLTEGQLLAPQAQAAAALAIETEHWDTAVETVTEIVRRLPVEEGHPVVHWETMTAVWLGLWAAAEATRDRGDPGAAWLAPRLAELDQLLAAAARRPPERRTIRDQALLALCEAERARVEGSGASGDWRRAVEALDELGAVAQRAYARVRLAETLLAEDAERSAAAHALNEAVDLFAGAPQSPIRARAERVARRARLRIAERREDATTIATHARFGLTEREVDVLRLLGEARTNREIGATLFISPKTVSVHVTSLMRKLGVRRRADAARLARRTMLEDGAR